MRLARFVIDNSPRQFIDVDVRLLENLATIAMNEIELRIAQGNSTEKKQFTNRDKLTNDYNRKIFKKLFSAECARAHSHGNPFSLAIIHLDDLNAIA